MPRTTYHAERYCAETVVVVVLGVKHALDETMTKPEGGCGETVEHVHGYIGVVTCTDTWQGETTCGQMVLVV